MKVSISKVLFLIADVVTIAVSITGAYYLCMILENHSLGISISQELSFYLGMNFFYVAIVTVMFFEGIYTKRFDLWQEHQQIGRSLMISYLIVTAGLALLQNDQYSDLIFLTSFALMFILLPAQKYIIKRALFKAHFWERKAMILGNDPFLEEHVFSNPYLGYVKADAESAKTIFIASYNIEAQEVESLLNEQMMENKEVIFLPVIKSYDFSKSYIVYLFNAHSNLVVLENNLLNWFNKILKNVSDYILAVLLIIPITLIMSCIAVIMKMKNPHQSIFFKQIRMGKDGKTFVCYKFQTMIEDGGDVLNAYLKENPDELDYFKKFHKYQNDPRITKIGSFLRKTSLDELPQIINVLKGEMSFVGPRPYMIEERHKMGNMRSIILAVKPGITGLWQVSGRNNIDFSTRIELDTWYVRNWNLWTDFVVMIKTLRVVLFRVGAK